MRKWGRNRNLVYARDEITVEEAKEVLDRFKDGKVYITLTASSEEPAWDKMIEINQVTGYKLNGRGHEYDLNFKDKQYFCDGAGFYMTESEARAVYFMLTSDIVVSGFSDIASNMKRRYKHSTILEELYNGELAIVEKK